MPALRNTSRPAANFTAASQLQAAPKTHASYQLVHATQDSQDLPAQIPPLVRPLSQAPAQQPSMPHQGKPKGSGPETGAAPVAAAAWSEAATLEPCLQLLEQGQVSEALDLLQELTTQHGPPDRDVGDIVLLVRPSSPTC